MNNLLSNGLSVLSYHCSNHCVENEDSIDHEFHAKEGGNGRKEQLSGTVQVMDKHAVQAFEDL
jgi:hypothetical protein